MTGELWVASCIHMDGRDPIIRIFSNCSTMPSLCDIVLVLEQPLDCITPNWTLHLTGGDLTSFEMPKYIIKHINTAHIYAATLTWGLKQDLLTSSNTPYFPKECFTIHVYEFHYETRRGTLVGAFIALL